MKALFLRGGRFMTFGSGGSVASASAANVSMIRFTHSIWITVSGRSTPINGPTIAMVSATTLTVSWNSMNRWMLR